MKTKQVIAFALPVAGLLATGAAFAEETKSPWKMSAELGYVLTGGNTETSSFNAKYDATHEKEKWRNNVKLEAFSASTTDTTTDIKDRSAERYQASGKTDYKFNELDYAFGTLVYDKDRFSGYDYQATLAAGYGRRVITDDSMKLDLEIGPGARKVKDATTGLTETDGIVRVGAKFEWKVSDTATFTEDFTSDINSDLTVTKSVTALTAKVNSKLAMKVSLTLKNNSEVPAGTEKTDSETAITLVYSF